MSSSSLAGPVAPWTFGRHVALSSGWFGFNFHWLPIGFILIQAQVRELVPRASEGTSIGLAVGLGGVFAVTVPPLVGHFSDRLNTRWGRRRPILAAGTVLNLVGLAIMATATTYSQLVIGYLWIQLFNNAASAAYAGIIPDVVRDEEFGRASGFLAAMNNLGGILGVGAALLFSSLHQIRLTYAVIGAVIVLSILPVLWASRGEGMNAPTARPRQGLVAEVRRFLEPLRGGDFAWVIFTRLMITAGINVVAYFLSPFFRDVVH
ncbi:MAG: MFS transporter, partial [Candidatus Dormibacteraeota bacterium]|nr:MFS transporter [Candidatus Dormibacteraeota bacterium]